MRCFKISFFALVALTIGIGCGDDKPGDVEPDAGDPAPAVNCTNYCAAVKANCTAANQQYTQDVICLSTCALFPPGTPTDMAGNTLGCHFNHANLAAENPNVHCGHAGPSGNLVCGASACENFCDMAQTACVPPAAQPYADKAACLAACATFPTDPPYSAATTSGNSLACRINHLTFASENPAQATNHCRHLVPNDPARSPKFPCDVP